MSARLDLTAEQEIQARELAARIQSRSASVILEMARTLVATEDATLFGDTELRLRDQALEVVADAYVEHVGQKKTATSARRSTVRTAGKRRRSTATGNEAS
jgi:hypothetical protein